MAAAAASPSRPVGNSASKAVAGRLLCLWAPGLLLGPSEAKRSRGALGVLRTMRELIKVLWAALLARPGPTG